MDYICFTLVRDRLPVLESWLVLLVTVLLWNPMTVPLSQYKCAETGTPCAASPSDELSNVDVLSLTGTPCAASPSDELSNVDVLSLVKTCNRSEVKGVEKRLLDQSEESSHLLTKKIQARRWNTVSLHGK